MATYAVFDGSGLIDNRIALDDPGLWEVPAGHSIVEETGMPMAIGGSYIDGVYAPPTQQPFPPPQPLPTELHQVLFDHENRILTMEGYEPLTIEEFLDKLG